jgi:hypothetical protein
MSYVARTPLPTTELRRTHHIATLHRRIPLSYTATPNPTELRRTQNELRRTPLRYAASPLSNAATPLSYAATH